MAERVSGSRFACGCSGRALVCPSTFDCRPISCRTWAASSAIRRRRSRFCRSTSITTTICRLFARASSRIWSRLATGGGEPGQHVDDLLHLAFHQQVEVLAHLDDVGIQLHRFQLVLFELLDLHVEHARHQGTGHGADLLLRELPVQRPLDVGQPLGMHRGGGQARSHCE